MDKKIVFIGGGKGVFTVLYGLKGYFENLTAVVTMADNGGPFKFSRAIYNHFREKYHPLVRFQSVQDHLGVRSVVGFYNPSGNKMASSKNSRLSCKQLSP